MNIATRLTAMFVLAALIPVATVGFLSYRSAASGLHDAAFDKAQQEAALMSQDLGTFLEQFSADLLSFADTPPVQGIVRAQDNGGIDPAQGDPSAVWVNRLTQIFKAAAVNKEFYQQLRYLNENGDEMVRVDYKNGVVELVSGTNGLQNKASSSYFTDTMGLPAGQVAVSAINLNREGGSIQVPHTPVIRFSTPVYDSVGTFRGAIVSNVYAQSFLSRLTTEVGDVYIVNENGSYALHPDADQTFGADLDTGVTATAEFGDVLSAANGKSLVTLSADAVVALHSLRFDVNNPTRSWTLIRTYPESVVLGPISALRLLILGVSAGMIIAIALVGMWMARSITRPILRIARQASDLADRVIPGLSATVNAVANGDLTKSATIDAERLKLNRKDELGDMAQSFDSMIDQLESVGQGTNAMMAHLRDLISNVAATSQRLADASGQLSSSSDRTGGAANEIARTNEQVARSADEQARAAQETTDSTQMLGQAIDQIAKGGQEQAIAIAQAANIVNQVSRAANDVATSAQAAAEGSRSASEAAQVGMDQMSKTVDGMGRIKVSVDSVSTTISELGERSAEIGQIIGVIDGIAAQTNLLALNAAIEAARAGEQGRGFAIVADEVRKLSEQVSMSTKEIAAIVDAVQNGVNESIRATEEGATQVAQGYQLADEAGTSLQRILSTVEDVAGQVVHISSATEEVSASGDEMVHTIEGVSAVIEQNSAATEEMAHNSTQVAQSVEAIATIAEENSGATQKASAMAEGVTSQIQEVVQAAQAFSVMAQELRSAVATFNLGNTGGNAARRSPGAPVTTAFPELTTRPRAAAV